MLSTYPEAEIYLQEVKSHPRDFYNMLVLLSLLDTFKITILSNPFSLSGSRSSYWVNNAYNKYHTA